VHLRKHLTTIGRDQSPKDLSSILLQGLWLFLGGFSEFCNKLELDKLIICVSFLRSFHDRDLLLQGDNSGILGFNAILQRLDGLLDSLGDNAL